MSEEHQTIESNDTAPSRGRVIVLAVIMYAFVACLGWYFFVQVSVSEEDLLVQETNTQNVLPQASTYSQSAYYANQESRLLIPEQIAFANMAPVANTVELATLLGNNPQIRIIFVDPRIVDEIDGSWLSQQYGNGKLIVGLNIPHSEMGELLEVTPNQNDLSEAEIRDSVISISLYRQNGDQTMELTASYDQFSDMMTTVHAMAR